MDQIRLRGIQVWAHHGVFPEERQRGQSFVVDLTLDVDLAEAAASDELGATVDYGELARQVAQAAAGGPYRLIETVAGRVLEVALADPRVRAAEVTVAKPHAPLPVPAGGVSVTLRRGREP